MDVEDETVEEDRDEDRRDQVADKFKPEVKLHGKALAIGCERAGCAPYRFDRIVRYSVEDVVECEQLDLEQREHADVLDTEAGGETGAGEQKPAEPAGGKVALPFGDQIG